MRVLISSDIPVSFVCGSSYFIKRLANLLKQGGHEVAVLCPGHRTTSTIREEEGLRVYGAPSLPSIVQKYLRLSPPFVINRFVDRTLDDFKPDIVHIQSHFFLPHRAAKAARRRDVVTVGTNHFIPENVFPHLHLPAHVTEFVNKLGWRHLHYIFKKLSAVTTPTETAAGFMQRSGFFKEIKPVSNGIDLRHFHPNHPSAHVARLYNLPHVPRLLYVGRLDPEKSVDILIGAMPHVLKQMDAHLVIAGRGAKEASLKKQVERLNLHKHVTFTGFVADSDLPALYCAVQCFVMPSTAELQCIAAMEAMASKLPVIAANALALPELVHHGRNGFLFTPGDSEELASAITEILSDPDRQKLMGTASMQIVEKHDISLTLEAFEDLYRDALKKNLT